MNGLPWQGVLSLLSSLLLALPLFLAGCQEPIGTRATGPLPTVNTAPSSLAPFSDLDQGRELFRDKGCWYCHGSMAEGHVAPSLSGTSLTFDEVKDQLRKPAMMPAFSEDEVSDEQLQNIYEWLLTLPPPP